MSAMERGRSFVQGMVHTIAWLAKAMVAAAAIYIFFPPFWDAAFAGNLQALHDAPYRAAERARHLWDLLSRTAVGLAPHRGERPPGPPSRTL